MKSFTFAVKAALLAAAAVATGNAFAASASADATATVVTPIAITSTADLVFGKFSAGTGGSVVMSNAGARSKTGSVVLLTGTAGGAAGFNVTGDANATYSISLPADDSVTVSDGASHSMAVDSFISNPGSSGTLTGGAQAVAVGATLTVGSGQAAGAYTGTFAVGVEYN
ncbi:MAG TPA: DUF4402 domain-containing protein [Solimonas sp.]|nr:DUF4402 domain-containing protein [Solimonas sp.]